MKVISSWFYTHGPGEQGEYAQVKGDVASEKFRDVYRRCIGVFFATARSAEPEARLVLFSNVEWDTHASQVAAEVRALLQRLGVEVITLPYHHEPPRSWPAAWRNQFFVLDVLTWAADELTSEDRLLVLDSDVVFSGSPRMRGLWDAIEARGGIALEIDYPPDHVVNSLSRRQMSHLMAERDPSLVPIAYCGGEFIALSGRILAEVRSVADAVYADNVSRSAGGTLYAFEEAHVLSVVYHRLGIEAGSANAFVKRMWTQPLKPRNVDRSDLALPLWHLPAEKRYGIRRLYRRVVPRSSPASSAPARSTLDATAMAPDLGVPRNTVKKWTSDVLYAGYNKIRRAL